MSSSSEKPDLDEIRDRILSGAIDADLLWSVGQAFGGVGSEPSAVGSWIHSRPADPDSDLKLTTGEAETVHTALITFITDRTEHPQGPLAVWAIGKLARREDESVFRGAVQRGLEGNDDLLYQAIIALDNLGVLPGEVTSFSAHDVEANRAIGRGYLESH